MSPNATDFISPFYLIDFFFQNPKSENEHKQAPI